VVLLHLPQTVVPHTWKIRGMLRIVETSGLGLAPQSGQFVGCFSRWLRAATELPADHAPWLCFAAPPRLSTLGGTQVPEKPFLPTEQQRRGELLPVLPSAIGNRHLPVRPRRMLHLPGEVLPATPRTSSVLAIRNRQGGNLSSMAGSCFGAAPTDANFGTALAIAGGAPEKTNRLSSRNHAKVHTFWRETI
jgi:hypothetical protein